jgi:N-acyl-D-amino-acid deacylase
MPEAIELIEKARNSGVDLSFDMYPYTAGSSSILQLLPPSAIEGGIHKFIDRLNDTEFYEKTRNLVENGLEGEWESKIQLIGWDNVFISNSINKQLEGKSIRESANILSMDCFDLMIHAIRLDLGTTNIIMFQQSEQDLRTVHLSRLQMVSNHKYTYSIHKYSLKILLFCLNINKILNLIR